MAKVEYKKYPEETVADYQMRMCKLKISEDLTWVEITKIINEELGLNYSESKYRKMYNNSLKTVSQSSEDIKEQVSLLKEQVKTRDLKNQFNAFVRKVAREEENERIAYECASIVAKTIQFHEPLIEEKFKIFENKDKAGILCLSDVHYGIVFKNFLNEYNPEIAQQRLELLCEKVIEYGLKEGISKLYVANLGDMIAGMIHLQIRLESRENVVQQTMSISELLAQFLQSLSKYFKIEYYDCLDNHSRVDVNKDTSMSMESYTLFIPWYLKARLKDNNRIIIKDSEIDRDFINFEVLGHSIIGVHGHKDKPSEIVKELTCLTRKTYDLAIMGHRHHFSADEQQGTVIISNGSLMGTDNYAKDLRVASHATQNFIVVTNENPCECIYRICLN